MTTRETQAKIARDVREYLDNQTRETGTFSDGDVIDAIMTDDVAQIIDDYVHFSILQKHKGGERGCGTPE